MSGLGVKLKREVRHRDYLMKVLVKPVDAAAYLNAVAKDGEIKFFLKALRNVVEAQGDIRGKKMSTVLQRIFTMVKPPVFKALERLTKKDKVLISQKIRDILLKVLESFEDNNWESIVRMRRKNKIQSISHKKFWEKEESIRRGLADAKSGRLINAPEDYSKYIKKQRFSMNNVSFIVTIPKVLIRKIDREKKMQSMSRNTLIQKMIKSYFKKHRLSKRQLESCIEGYKKKPEKELDDWRTLS